MKTVVSSSGDHASATFHRKGQSVCANNRQAVMEEADAEVMTAVQDELRDPAVVAFALQTALASLTTVRDPRNPFQEGVTLPS